MTMLPGKFRPSVRLLAALVVLLALGACRRASTSSLPVLAREPNWSLTDLDGHEVGAASLRGRVVVVDFWATWCPPCVEEIPGYIALQKKYGADGLVIVGLSVDRAGQEVVRNFMAQKGLNYRVALADDATVAAFGGINDFPTTFLIDRTGNIRQRKTGMMAPAEYEKLVQSLL